MNKPTIITIKSLVEAPIQKIWEAWTEPSEIINWYFASDNRGGLVAENDLRINGRFKVKMSANDKSSGFDFTGTYKNIKYHELIKYEIDDGRHVKTQFIPAQGGTLIIQSFEAENINSPEMQESGWQSIINNFKRYLEENNN